jgi:hypothetical protein
MAIDGRDIARARDASKPGPQPLPPQGGRDAYESRGVGLLSHALVWVPLALIVWFAYVSGTWIGGPVEGLVNVGVTVLTFAGIWGWRYVHKKRK